MKFSIKYLKEFMWNKIKKQKMFKDKSNDNLKVTLITGYFVAIMSFIFEMLLIFVLYILLHFLNNKYIIMLYLILFIWFSIVSYIYFYGGIMIIKYSYILKKKNK